MLIKSTITDALMSLGVVTMGEELTPEEHLQGLKVLNGMIDSYNSQSLLIAHTVNLNLNAPQTLNPCTVPDNLNTIRKWKTTVTIGDCEDYNIIAPTHISVIATVNKEGKSTILKRITIEEALNPSLTPPDGVWVEIGDKKSTLTFNGIIAETDTLTLICKLPYRGTLEDGSYSNWDDVNWDYGVERMLRLNLAVELSSYYGVNPPQTIMFQAQESLQTLKDKAFLLKPLSLDRSLKGY